MYSGKLIYGYITNLKKNYFLLVYVLKYLATIYLNLFLTGHVQCISMKTDKTEKDITNTNN